MHVPTYIRHMRGPCIHAGAISVRGETQTVGVRIIIQWLAESQGHYGFNRRTNRSILSFSYVRTNAGARPDDPIDSLRTAGSM